MKDNKKKLVKEFIEFLSEPRTIKEVQKKFGLKLKFYLNKTKKKYRLIRTVEKKFYLLKKEKIDRQFEILDVKTEDNCNDNFSEMKAVVIIFPPKWRKIRLVPIADVYYGSELFNDRKMKRYIEWISRDEHVFCYMNGNIFAPIKNINEFNKNLNDFQTKIWKPLKSKILFVVNGPNEKRLEASKIGINPLKFLAENYQIPFFEDQANVLIKFKDSDKYFKIFSIHGKSNAIKIGGKINAVMDLLKFIDADIVTMSNLKYTSIKRTEIFVLQSKKLEIEQKKVYIVSLPSFLKYQGSEDALKGHPPYYSGQVNIVLYNNGDYHVFSGKLKSGEEVLYEKN